MNQASKTTCQIVTAGLYTISQYILMVAITKFYGASGFGEYTYTLALITPVFMFFEGNLRNIISSDINTPLPDIVYTSFKFGLVSCACLLSAIAIVTQKPPSLALSILILFIKVAETFSNFCYGLYQRNHEEHKICISQLVRAIAYSSVLLSTILGFSLMGALTILAATLLVNSAVDISGVKLSNFKVRKSVKPLFNLFTIFAFVVLLHSLRQNSAVYFIEQNFSFYILGIYSSIYYISVAMSRPSLAYFNAKLTHIAENAASRSTFNLLSIYTKLSSISLLTTIIALFAVNYKDGYLLSILIKDNSAEYLSFLNKVVLAMPLAHIGTVIMQSTIAFGGKIIQLLHAAISLAMIWIFFGLFYVPGDIDSVANAILAESMFYIIFSISIAILAYRKYPPSLMSN